MLIKYLQNIGLKGRQIISLPGAPTCVYPALLMQKVVVSTGALTQVIC
jgi:hypothetical protein